MSGIFIYHTYMTNRLAPYKNPEVMDNIKAWWNATYPDNRAEGDQPVHILELYASYCDYSGLDLFDPLRPDANQFAKCLVAASIIDVGGWWKMAEDWVPKDWEVKRAKVY